MGASLIGDKHVHERITNDVGLFEVIFGGASGAMQPFGKRMTQDQILKVMAYTADPDEELTWKGCCNERQSSPRRRRQHARPTDRFGLTCPCCGARVGLRADNGSARLELEEAGHSLTFPAGTMFVDPHAHMISRTTDDYEAMARAGVVAVIEPAFWIGQPRTNLGSYVDYLSTIVGFERFRAGQFGIRHYCTIGLNSKEANNQALAEAVLEVLPHFATKESVVAIGEIGYDEQTALEDKYLRQQIELAKELELPIMIHTPHRDKKRGTTRTMDVLVEHGFDPRRCVIDHNNEETVQEVLDRGFYAGFSIYPHTKMGNERMTEIVRQYGPERIVVDFRMRLGHLRPARGAEDGRADGRARHRGRCHPAGHLRQCARGLRTERRHARSGLARSDPARPTDPVRRQQRAARRADTAHRTDPPFDDRSADRVTM